MRSCPKSLGTKSSTHFKGRYIKRLKRDLEESKIQTEDNGK